MSERHAGAKQRVHMLVVSSDTYPPFRVDVSVLFGRELAARGHHIDWLLQSEAKCDKSTKVAWGGGNVWVGPTDLGTSLPRRIRKHALGILHDLKLFSLLRKGDYQIIGVKDKFVSGVFAVVAARLFRKRFVYWLSYPFPEDYLHRADDLTGLYRILYRMRGTAFKVLLYRFLLRAADRVFVQSEQMRRDLVGEGIPASKMTAVPMGVDAASFESTSGPTRSRVPPGDHCILYLGTIVKVRRLDFLIRVLAKVRESVLDAKLYIVGGGNDASDERLLLDEAARLGLESAVVMVGHVPRARALEYVHDADVCVSPFYPTPILNSTSPTKLVEYMAMGKSVVANDHPEQRLVIERSGAGYCVPWDEAEFARAIVALFNAPDQAREMGERGRRYVMQHRSYARIADLVERELLEIAGLPQAP
jgi:glycosyltransferase involved in cell wall biosynthesis